MRQMRAGTSPAPTSNQKNLDDRNRSNATVASLQTDRLKGTAIMLFAARAAFRALILVVLLASVFAQFTTNAQTIPSQFYDAMRWRLIGPHRGGRALAVSGVRGQPETFYFGAVGGGVWKTTDAGEVWQPIFDDQPISSIGALAVAPSDPNTIYVGSGEADMRSDISFGDGLYKSTDADKTWSHLGLRD